VDFGQISEAPKKLELGNLSLRSVAQYACLKPRIAGNKFAMSMQTATWRQKKERYVNTSSGAKRKEKQKVEIKLWRVLATAASVGIGI
jgi:hypothetical protein